MSKQERQREPEEESGATRSFGGLSLAEMFREELLDQFPVLGAQERRTAVPAPLDHMEIDLHAGFLQRLGKLLALGQGHDPVLVAVEDKERGGILVDVVDRTGLPGLFLVFMRRAADQASDHRVGVRC